MASRKGAANRFNPVRGWVTEGNLAQYPQDVALDIENMTIDKVGLTERRRGFESDSGANNFLPELSVAARDAGLVNIKEWRAIGDGLERNLLLVHAGSNVYVMEDTFPAIATNEVLTIDLTEAGIKLDGTVSEPCHFSVGVNFAIITNPRINPVLVVYEREEDDGALTLTYRPLNLQIRTQSLLEPYTGGATYGGELSPEEEWNLRNSGWTTIARCASDREGSGTTYEDPVKYYFDQRGAYPRHSVLYNSMKLSSAKEVVAVGAFSPWEDEKINFGDTIPPLGRYTHSAYDFDSRSIMEGFYVDGETPAPPEGSNVGNVNNLDLISEGTVTWTVRDRPRCSGYHNGHVYFGDKDREGKTRILVSQLVSDLDNIEKCYQDADPSAEEINDLVATDGYVMYPVGMGTILNMIEFNRGLVVLATNGAWQIKGTQGGGATATDFTIDKIATFDFNSPYSLIDAGSAIMMWTDRGIIAVGVNEFGDITSQNLTENTIDEYYDTLARTVIRGVHGVYVNDERRAYWTVPKVQTGVEASTKDADLILILNLDTGGFYKYTLGGDVQVHLPFTKLSTSLDTADVQITETDGTGITTTGGDPVTVSRSFRGQDRAEVAYLSTTQAGDLNFAAVERSMSFKDWGNIATVTDVEQQAFVEFAYEYPSNMIGSLSVPYVHSFFLQEIRGEVQVPQGPTIHTEMAQVQFHRVELLLTPKLQTVSWHRVDTLLNPEMAVVSFWRDDLERIETVNVVNGGAENGDATGWTVTRGTLDVRTASPDPHSGTYYFWSDSNGSMDANQVIDLVSDGNITAGEPATKRIEAVMTWYGNGASLDDELDLALAALDGGGATLVSTGSDPYPPNVGEWHVYTKRLVLPAGTEQLRVEINMDFDRSPDLNCYLDDIEIELRVHNN